MINNEIEHEVIIEDGKYTLRFYKDGRFHCLRYGLEWRDLAGDKMVLALVNEISTLREKLKKIYSPVNNFLYKDNQPCGYQPDKVFETDKIKFTPNPKFGGFPLDETKNE
jgi:hypothetical protein